MSRRISHLISKKPAMNPTATKNAATTTSAIIATVNVSIASIRSPAYCSAFSTKGKMLLLSVSVSHSLSKIVPTADSGCDQSSDLTASKRLSSRCSTSITADERMSCIDATRSESAVFAPGRKTDRPMISPSASVPSGVKKYLRLTK